MYRFLSIAILFIGIVSQISCHDTCRNEDCPVKCNYKSISILKDGKNVFFTESEKYNIEKLNIHSSSEEPVLLTTVNTEEERYFQLNLCDNEVYVLELNENERIKVEAEMSAIKLNDCCDYYTLSTITIDGQIYCSNETECDNSIYIELTN